MLELHFLSPELFDLYEERFIFPNALRTVGLVHERLAIGATWNKQPVGVIVAKKEGKKAELISLYVDPAHRKKGIGSALVQVLEKSVQDAGGVSLIFRYVDSEEMAGFLLAQKWNKDPLLSILYTHDGSTQIADQELYNQGNYQVSLFTEITEEEKKWFIDNPDLSSPELHPFLEKLDAPVEPLNSLVLRKDGQIKGWLITHRIAENTISYSKLYVMKEERKHFAGLYLMHEALKRHYAIWDQIPKGVWSRFNRKMLDSFLVRHNFFPNQKSIVQLKQLQKNLLN
jgi:GNAT superfamily N-acetyltransferase